MGSECLQPNLKRLVVCRFFFKEPLHPIGQAAVTLSQCLLLYISPVLLQNSQEYLTYIYSQSGITNADKI